MDSENWVWGQSNSKNGLRKFYYMYAASHDSNNVQNREQVRGTPIMMRDSTTTAKP